MRTPLRRILSAGVLAFAVVGTAPALALNLGAPLLDDVSTLFGPDARERVEDWESLVQRIDGAAVKDQLQSVNRFFNQVPFVSDLEHWGTEDYWATPVELLATNAGDCEDYSIAKYLTLKALGVKPDRLRIIYVKALTLNQAHMVLAYYPAPDAEPLILDNLVETIQPASERTDLEPVYSFNGDGIWLTRLQQQRKERRIGDPGRLGHWVDLNQRLIENLR